MASDLVIFDPSFENLLIYEVDQEDTLVWAETTFSITSVVDLCDLVGIGAAVTVVGITPKVDLIGEVFGILVNAAMLQFDGFGVLCKSQFTGIKSVANLIGFYTGFSELAELTNGVAGANNGEFVVVAEAGNFELTGEAYKIDVLAEPNSEC